MIGAAMEIKEGDFAVFRGEDSYYEGIIVSIFKKKNGAVRVIIEDDRGLLLIKNPQHGVFSRGRYVGKTEG